MKRWPVVLVAVLTMWGAAAAPALACGGLVNPNGTVSLVKTTTLAGYRNGIEHYITSFEFAGGGAEFGSIVPLPGIPSKIQRAGDWTLQRLVEEITPEPEFVFFRSAGADSALKAEVIEEVRIDALDITILKGGGDSVGEWAEDNGFALTPDAPEVLDFYAERSPIFMAARFDPSAARNLGQNVGDGTPIHLSIPTPNPWVPLRILSLGLGEKAQVEADVFLLTEQVPDLLPVPEPAGSEDGMILEVSEPASSDLIRDLAANKGMDWVTPLEGAADGSTHGPGMWLSYLKIDTAAGDLDHDLAIDPTGLGTPSRVAAGLVLPEEVTEAVSRTPLWAWALAAALVAATVGLGNKALGGR